MIAIACDHAGYELKPYVIAVLDEMGLEYKDFGTFGPEAVDYPIFGARAANAVATGECDRGIILCGTGIGISLTANKVKGIRCAVGNDLFSAKLCRLHNDANMLAMGARIIGSGLCKEIVRVFLTTPFDGERHRTRVDMISSVEKGDAL